VSWSFGRGLVTTAAFASFACAVSACSTPPVSGMLTIAGSQTMQSLIARSVAGYAADRAMVDIKLEFIGSSGSVLLFCEGLAQVIGASRPMSDKERAACELEGIRPAELLVGRDAVVIATGSASNAPACLTDAELYALTSVELDATFAKSAADRNWQDARGLSTELGSTADLPNAAWEFVIPNPASATIETYIERVIEPLATERGEVSALTSARSVTTSNNAVLNAIDDRPAALGIVDYSSFRAWPGDLRLVGLGEGDACVIPNDTSVGQGIYPLSRSLYFYVDAGAAENRAVREFAEYLTSDEVMSSIAARSALELLPDERRASVDTFRAQMEGDSS
jgi:phosphate transport system substrate-binding protein